MYHTPYSFGIYEKALRPQPWGILFKSTKQAGFDYFEISLDESDLRLERLKWPYARCREIADLADGCGLHLLTACLSGHRRFPLGSANANIAARSMEIMRDAITFCANTGIRILQIAGYDVFYEPHSESTANRYCENLEKSVHIAAQAGVMLAIEPVEIFLTDVEKTLRLVRQINSPWLQIYPDVANMAALGIDPAPELLRGAGHIVAVHMRDALPNYFYNVPPGAGILNFESAFKALDQIGYTGPITIEMWNETDPDDTITVKNAREFMLHKIKNARQNKRKEA